MPETDDGPLRDILSRVKIYPREPVDFTQTDPETTLTKVRLLAHEAAYLNTVVVAQFGGRSGPERQPGLVDQIVGAAFQTYGDVDPHPEPFAKAAMLLRGITQGHPFTDGNKRTGLLLAAYFLERMGYPFPDELPVDEVVEFCLAVSAGEIRELDEIADKLRQWWSRAR